MPLDQLIPGTVGMETRIAWSLSLWIVLGFRMVGSIVYGLITGT